MKMNDKVYDFLKWVAQLLLPAFATLYFALSNIWGLPYGEQIVGTITAVDTFLGVILGISTKKYSGDGTLKIDTSGNVKDIYRLDLGDNIENLAGKKKVTLLVENNASLK